MRDRVASQVTAGAGCALLLGLLAGAAAAQTSREAPLVLDFREGIRTELVGLRFVDSVVDGDKTMVIAPAKRNLYRLAIATIKITKPAGSKLTLACADVTMHYYHGEQAEVTPCEGLSPFTTALETERAINLSSSSGPGFFKQHTLPRTTEAATVYIDALFGSLEPDTQEAWIAVGQVSDRQRPFASKGWKP